ncbi:MAG TPA: DUF805 domain-containing protein [Gammaproteobacteria bacterium]
MVQANPYAAPSSSLTVESTDEVGDSPVFSFSGRAGRLRYLARVSLFTVAIYFVVGLIFAVILGLEPNAVGASIAIGYGLVFIASIVFAVMFAMQRLHDMNHSGWMSLLLFVPLVNVAVGLYLLFGRGTQGANDYGPPPPPNTLGVKLAALIFPVLFAIGMIAAITIPAYQDYATRVEQAQPIGAE